MGTAKKPRSTASKLSAAAAPAASSNALSASKSSILRSSFAPSYLQLALFASVIQGFDSQQLRIHDTYTGRLRCEHAIGSKATINCLDWGFYGGKYWDHHQRELKKKRKRTEQVNGFTHTDNAQAVVLAFGTSESEIHLFSPTAAKTVCILKDAHTQGIRDFRFVDAGRLSEGWSIGGDGMLVRWDLQKGISTKVLSLPDQSARTLCPFGSYILCAALKVFLIDPESLEPTISFSASNNAVHSIRASAAKQSNLSSPSSFLTAAENDRFINVFVKEAGACIGSLVAESDVITIISPAIDRDASSENDMTTNATDQILAAINRDGVVELFESPFTFGSSTAQKEPESLKARMTQRTRKARALVKVVRSDRSTARVPLLDAAFQDHELVLVWTEGGVDLRFDRVQWRKADTMDIILEGVHEVVKGKEAAAVEAVVMNGVKDMGKMHVDESHTVVAAGGQLRSSEVAAGEPVFIAISSGEEETDYEDDELPEQMSQSSSDEDPPPPAPVSQKGDTPPSEGDARMEDANEDGRDAHQGATEADEPTFGEIIRANASGPVDVQAAFANPNTQGFAPANERSLQIPSGMSLGTVLTQSLRTNDISLLETCLHVRDVATIRATIERLDSSLASTLIQRLAERFHSRPGRAGSLLMWIQWTVVAHGGYLASQPGAMRTLGSLHRVISERARSLPLLLSLKGKLDMLEAQMNLRATAQARSKAQSGLNEEDEEGVVYVEGQEEDASEDEPQGSDADDVEMDALDNGMALDDAMESREDEGSGFEEEDEMPTTMPNGATTESDNEGSQSSSEGLFDEEAESTDGDSSGEGSIDDVDHEDVDSMGSDASSDAEEARPSKRPARTKLSNGVRPKK